MSNNVINIFKELEELYPNEGLINSLSNVYKNRVDEFLKLKSKYDKYVGMFCIVWRNKNIYVLFVFMNNNIKRLLYVLLCT